jgi:hypothetical protein
MAVAPLTRRRYLGYSVFVSCGLLLDRSAIASGWPSVHREGSLHYHADFDLDRARFAMEETRQLTQTVPSDLAMTATEEPIYLYLFAHQQTYRRYLSQYFPSVPYRRALFIKQRGPGMVFAHYNEEFTIDLRHETTHAILHTMLPLVPLWLDEGLAEYYEVSETDRYAGSPHLAPVQRNVGWWRRPSLARLESQHELEDMDSDDYRAAWAWVHFFLHGPPAIRDEFLRYLADIHAHTPPGLLSHRLRRRHPRYEQLFSRHFADLP